jgi:hypothetical protein
MSVKKALLMGLGFLSVLLIAGCTRQIAGVETTNGCTVVATAAGIEGTVPPQSRVFVFDTSYIPYIDSGVGIGTAADNNGAFQFKTLPGKYNILVIGPTGEAAGIAITSGDAATVSKEQRLELPGAVSGTISSAAGDTLLIFLEGMCQYQIVSVPRSFILKNIPKGTYALKIARISSPGSGSGMKILREERVLVTAGSTTALGDITL